VFDKEQERWNDVLARHWWGKGHYAVVKALMSEALSGRQRSGAVCLDIGCSGGVMAEFLRGYGKIFGFDISADGLAYGSGGFPVVQADALAIPFKDASFDIITALDVAEHVEDDSRLFSEACRVAKKGCLVFVNVPVFMFFWRSHDVRYGHRRRYTRPGLLKLLRPYPLTVEKMVYLHAHFVLPLAVSALMDRVCPKKDDFVSFGPVGDRLLLESLLLESRLARRFAMPTGIFLFCVLRKTG
jgi:ubiquinone/menaquinone biosynthesis C-methylase UbiE